MTPYAPKDRLYWFDETTVMSDGTVGGWVGVEIIDQVGEGRFSNDPIYRIRSPHREVVLLHYDLHERPPKGVKPWPLATPEPSRWARLLDAAKAVALRFGWKGL